VKEGAKEAVQGPTTYYKEPSRLNEMQPSESEQRAFAQLRQLIADRAYSYETGVQTTILGRQQEGWGNLLTELDFIYKHRPVPEPVLYNYPDLIVARRAVEIPRLSALLQKLFQEGRLETGTNPGQVPASVHLSHQHSVRSSRREWSPWPGDIVYFSPTSEHVRALYPQASLVALDAPYYPSPGHVLFDLFGFRPINWNDYLGGQVILLVPDFRARISKLEIGRGYLRADLDCPFSPPSELVAKAYAETSTGPLAQKTIALADQYVELSLDASPTFASVALLSKSSGELLHEKSFDEKRAWVDAEVIIKISEQDVEQMLLLGECETLEFREKIEPVRLAKTIVAFANTRGGTIIVGVDDNHRVVGCDTKGLEEKVTSTLRYRCDPPPLVSTEIVQHQGRSLFLIRVSESKEDVHVEKEHGPLIRANGTNRTPTSHELDRLYQRGNSPGTNPLSPWF
jgi:hypothetical protein